MAPGLFVAELPGDWVLSEELHTCVVRTPNVSPDAWETDESRPEAVALAARLFTPEPTGFAPLQTASNKRPLLVVFPELAFGSVDFPVLDGLVRALGAPAIVVAGFGFASGAVLSKAIQTGAVLPSWEQGEQNLDPQSLYNSAWCWVHRPGVATSCWLIVKNRPEQTVEKHIPNLGTGATFLCLRGHDLFVFPVICFDFVDSTALGFVQRTRELRKGARSVVAVAARERVPHSFGWSKALGECVNQDGTSVVISNGAECAPDPDESTDKWRTLCGGFIARDVLHKMPDHPTPFVRLVLDSAAGLVLREGDFGAAAGPLCWMNRGTHAKDVWSPSWRVAWLDGKLVRIQRSPHAQEVDRFIRRFQSSIGHSLPSGNWVWLKASLALVQAEVLAGPVDRASILLDSLLNGLDRGRPSVHPDRIVERQNEVCRAVRALASVRGAAPGAAFVAQEARLFVTGGTQPRQYHVWVSQDLSSAQVITHARALADKGGSAVPVVLLAHAAMGQVPRGRVGGFRDAASPMAGESIGEPRVRRVYVVPVSEIEQQLLGGGNVQDEVREVLNETE